MVKQALLFLLSLSVISGMIANADEELPSFPPTRMGDVDIFIDMILRGDARGPNISWQLISEDQTFRIAVPAGSYTTNVIEDRIVAPGGQNYSFTIRDRGGDGLGEGGSYELTMGDAFDNFELASGSGDFQNGESTTSFFLYADPDDLPSPPTPSPGSPTPRPTPRPTPSPVSPPGPGPAPGPAPTSTLPPSSSRKTGLCQFLLGATFAIGAMFVV